MRGEFNEIFIPDHHAGFMILGIGSDLVDTQRIEKTLAQYGTRFIDRVFTEAERMAAAAKTNPALTYAKRFAAKEACAKALGTGLMGGALFRHIGVVNLPSGQPTCELTGKALERLQEMTPAGMQARLHLSLTDEPPYAQAFVVIEALPVA